MNKPAPALPSLNNTTDQGAIRKPPPKRTKAVLIRLTEEEYRLCREAAYKAMSSMQELFRVSGLGAAATALQLANMSKPEQLKMLRNVNKVMQITGNNVPDETIKNYQKQLSSFQNPPAMKMVDCIAMHKAHPKTFSIPTPKDISKLKVNDHVKVIFQDGPCNERCWYKITSRKGDTFTGVLANHPVFKLPHEISFSVKHIAAVYQ